ncbi:hypothetical protein ACGRL8_08360 [Vibrio rumoiensis]|uniref:hypothetical protein n=1 Tax=Vibrio rumoiensis TaxID=76258 RepID=UPI003748648E
MSKKILQWLDILKKLINIIRPKAYNTITRIVIGTGLLQITESQVKILHAFAIALFEEYIAKSEILREFLNATSDPTTGLILVAMGLIYHLVAYLGKDFIDAVKAKQPKIPELKLHFLNGDKEPLNSEFMIRGQLANILDRESIPDNTDEDEISNLEGEFGYMQKQILQMQRLSSPFGQRKNKDQYRERANVIDKWAGAELLYFSLKNHSSILVNDITIQLNIPRNSSRVSIEGNTLPQPRDLINIIDLTYPPIINEPKQIKLYDNIEISHTSKDFVVSWKARKLHGEATVESSECFLIQVREEISIECTIYCDELPKPYITTFEVKPPQKSSNVDLEELMDD